tara:strand:+ start:237 stop:425 length:189 start_codon:yes stop_codon:yes gene_type:complete
MVKKINIELTDPQWEMLQDALLAGETHIEHNTPIDEWDDAEYSERDVKVLHRAIAKIWRGKS